MAVARDRRHRLHRAGPAAAADPVSQAPGRQPHVPGRFLAPAAEAQHVGRHPADLRLLAAALPITVANFTAGERPGLAAARSPRCSATASRSTCSSTPALIVFFAFFYTAIVFNPKDTADNLKKYGGFIPGIRPGERTAEYIDYVLTRITVVGALSRAGLPPARVPRSRYTGVPFYFGGTSLLIVVSVTMDTVAQIQSHLIAQQYEGLIKKAQARRERDGDEADPARAARRRQRHAGARLAEERRHRPAFDRRHAARRRGGGDAVGTQPRRSWTGATLVPDDIVIGIIAERLDSPTRPRASSSTVFPGPRPGGGARPAADEQGTKLDAVVELKVDDEPWSSGSSAALLAPMRRGLSRRSRAAGRRCDRAATSSCAADDNAETLHESLEVYQRRPRRWPTITEKGKLKTVDGMAHRRGRARPSRRVWMRLRLEVGMSAVDLD